MSDDDVGIILDENVERCGVQDAEPKNKSAIALWSFKEDEMGLSHKVFDPEAWKELHEDQCYVVLHAYIENREHIKNDLPSADKSEDKVSLVDVLEKQLSKIVPETLQQAFNGADRDRFDLYTDVFRTDLPIRHRYSIYVWEGKAAPISAKAAALEYAYTLDRKLGMGIRQESVRALLALDSTRILDVICPAMVLGLMRGSEVLERTRQTQVISLLHSCQFIRRELLSFGLSAMQPETNEPARRDFIRA
ncbi:hypothetical protein J8273_5559 [Carpediemonas membranifera]|uniref:Uncharacterized protein n=1 Tax=Carpediemonas membranifera TaxID=201153 RepID=A0A8J6B1Z3_9EUKA|nr:hypothetical protein J8273_5559 [Carpediemonas membranifera]|eukprot:KAG9392554.1 hypothetical protein J8273_5559 [Carpediemonas membranifera]